jgi:acetate kinase
MTDIMNKKSGFLGMSEGVTSDCRDLVDRREAGDKRAKLILDKLVLDITKLVGGYIAEMNGVDLIVFTAGIAENNPWIRRDVCANFGYMGIEIDEEVNAKARRDNAIISTPASKVKVAMIPTDEELVIARDTMHLAEGRK